MATFTVWKFNDPTGAERSVGLLESLQRQELIHVVDAATVTWEPGKDKPKTRQVRNLAGIGALGGTFWGLLFGLLFFVPLLGALLGAAVGAIAGSLSDAGIDDDFIAEVRGEVTPGTSALFVMTTDAVRDKVSETFNDAGLHPTLIHTNLSNEQEEALRTAFAEESESA